MTIKYYQDFVGLNTMVYEPCGWYILEQTASVQTGSTITKGRENLTWIANTGINTYLAQNHIGSCLPSDTALTYEPGGLTDFPTASYGYSAPDKITKYTNYIFRFQFPIPKTWADKANYGAPKNSIGGAVFNGLMTHRNGPYGYPSWKQIRVGQNPLTRKQNLHNVFTYVEEPGPSNNYKIRGANYSNTNRYGSIKVFIEPVVSAPCKPLSLIGGIKIYNERTNTYGLKTVQMQTTFGNETLFFANDEINRNFGTIEETDENYENFKELYLDDGLDADGSPIDEFSLMVYRQTVWPKVVNAFLNRTRSRTHFVNKFWREDRRLRTRSSASCFGTTICNQSIWPLDVRGNFAVTGSPVIDGFTSGINDYVMVAYPLGGTNTGTYNSTSNWLQWNTGNRTTRANGSRSPWMFFGSSSYQG